MQNAPRDFKEQAACELTEPDAPLRFGLLIHHVSRLRRTVMDRALKPLGLTRSQWGVLAILSHRDGMTQTVLASDLELTKVAIGSLIDRLEASGFVERRADERDARARRVYLTEEGHCIVGTLRDNVYAVEAHILKTVDEKDLDQAVNVLATIKQQLVDLVEGDAEGIGVFDRVDDEAASKRNSPFRPAADYGAP
jgi:DNA-binding MarR family transcriptional regulator